MELLKQTAQWAQGDALHGKIMLGVGILTLIAIVFILRNDHAILKGTVIPLSLITLLGIGYGGFLSFSRPGHAKKVAELYESNPQQAVAAELEKAQRDAKAYTTIKKVWPVLIALAALMFYFVSKDYFKGLSIGLVATFLYGMILDTILHHNLQPYLEALQRWKG